MYLFSHWGGNNNTQRVLKTRINDFLGFFQISDATIWLNTYFLFCYCLCVVGHSVIRSFGRSVVRSSPLLKVSALLKDSANLPRTPNIFTDSGPPMYWLLGGLIRGDPDPPNPPYGGGQKYVFFGGGIADGTFWPPKSQLILGGSWLQISLGIP